MRMRIYNRKKFVSVYTLAISILKTLILSQFCRISIISKFLYLYTFAPKKVP
jgi:hypothetical protein